MWAGFDDCVFAEPLSGSDFFHCRFSGLGVESIYENNAIEVIGFMLDAAS
jgi:hypothetical protein